MASRKRPLIDLVGGQLVFGSLVDSNPGVDTVSSPSTCSPGMHSGCTEVFEEFGRGGSAKSMKVSSPASDDESDEEPWYCLPPRYVGQKVIGKGSFGLVIQA